MPALIVIRGDKEIRNREKVVILMLWSADDWDNYRESSRDVV